MNAVTEQLKPETAAEMPVPFVFSESAANKVKALLPKLSKDGRIVCVSLPQRYQVERRYLNTLLKLCFYAHALRRFDRPEAERAHANLLILWADEAQKVVTAADDGMSDYNVVDVIREARTWREFGLEFSLAFTVLDMLITLGPEEAEASALADEARAILTRLGATPLVKKLDEVMSPATRVTPESRAKEPASRSAGRS